MTQELIQLLEEFFTENKKTAWLYGNGVVGYKYDPCLAGFLEWLKEQENSPIDSTPSKGG